MPALGFEGNLKVGTPGNHNVVVEGSWWGIGRVRSRRA